MLKGLHHDFDVFGAAVDHFVPIDQVQVYAGQES